MSSGSTFHVSLAPPPRDHSKTVQILRVTSGEGVFLHFFIGQRKKKDKEQLDLSVIREVTVFSDPLKMWEKPICFVYDYCCYSLGKLLFLF